MISLKNRICDYWFLLIHLLVLIIGMLILGFFGVVTEIPTEAKLINWDAYWYESIKNNGYIYSPNEQSNVGFFPLFSYFWRVTRLNLLGISLVNLIIAFISLGMLKRVFEMKSREVLLFLSLPSVFFLYLPFTESFFFFFTTILLVGLKEDKIKFILIGLFFSSLIRPTSIFFIPAIIFMELIHTQELTLKNMLIPLKRILLYGGTSLCSLLLVVIIQWYQTGVFGAYFQAQIIHWHHEFRWPTFPLTTWDGSRLVWLEGIAFWFGAMALVFVVVTMYKYFLKNLKKLPNKSVLFSSVFIALTTVYVLFFSDVGAVGTSLTSLNRYIFVTPFMVVFLHYIISRLTFKAIHLFFLLIITCLIWLAFSGEYILDELNKFKLKGYTALAYFSIMTAYCVMFLFLTNKKYNKEILVVLYCVNMFLQIYLINTYFLGLWIG